ncbi:hypothetical protein AAVH_12495 [Aphelenchoides avenae]|nr:hypothetical protein AAVH_12495 [Aphelenchus avenae]
MVILRRGRKEKSFRQAFYVLFVAVTVVDCLLLIKDRLQIYNDKFYEATVYQPVQQTLDIVEYIGSNFQPLIHTAIAANRLTAFYYPLEYDSIWTPRVVCIVVAAIAGVAIALGR